MNKDYEEYITNIDEYNNETVEFEALTEKTIYNIYNNNVKFPSHNFWFMLNYVKFIKIDDMKNNKKSIKISFNDKFKDNKKTVDCIYSICQFVESECKKNNDQLIMEHPWNMKPILFNLHINELTILSNYNNEKIDIDYLEKTKKSKNTFTILFELIYYRIVDNVIKFSFQLIKLQEHENINIMKKSLFVQEAQPVKYYPPQNIHADALTQHIEAKQKQTMKSLENLKIAPVVSKPVFNVNEILNGKERLKKTPEKEIEPIHNAGEDYLKQKELLKSVSIVEEIITPKKIKKEKKVKKNKKNKEIKE